MKEAFRFFDKDNSGDVSRRELMQVLLVLHPHLTNKQIGDAIREWQGQSVMEEDFIETVSELNEMCRQYTIANGISKSRSNRGVTREAAESASSFNFSNAMTRRSSNKSLRAEGCDDTTRQHSVIGALQRQGTGTLNALKRQASRPLNVLTVQRSGSRRNAFGESADADAGEGGDDGGDADGGDADGGAF